jgi:hypothetical protein
MTAFPEDAELIRRLQQSLPARLHGREDLRLISRKPVAHPGKGYFAELVQTSDSTTVTSLFAKHGAAVTSDAPYRGGHVGGLAYEFHAQILAHGVANRGIAMPLGEARGLDGGMSIFSQEIQGNRLADAKMDGMVAAAKWLGEFHRDWEASDPPCSGINRLDENFLRQWLDRGFSTIETNSAEGAKKALVAEHYKYDAEILLGAPQVLLHGDCYRNNAITDNSGVWFIDWELAALGPGEVDLATLTLGWPPESVAVLTSAYASARWPSGPRPDIERRLVAARRYVLLRILSLPPRANRQERYLRRLNTLLTLPCT